MLPARARADQKRSRRLATALEKSHAVGAERDRVGRREGFDGASRARNTDRLPNHCLPHHSVSGSRESNPQVVRRARSTTHSIGATLRSVRCYALSVRWRWLWITAASPSGKTLPVQAKSGLKPACSKCRSAVSASLMPASCITTKDVQSVSDQFLSARLANRSKPRCNSRESSGTTVVR